MIQHRLSSAPGTTRRELFDAILHLNLGRAGDADEVN
jgi:hypothetical protein